MLSTQPYYWNYTIKYSAARYVLLITCTYYSVLHGLFCKTDTVCTVVLNCSTFVTLLQRYVAQCLRIIMCCLHEVCCTVISFTVLSMPSYIRYITFSPRHALLLTQAMCVCPISIHCCALLILYSIANLSCRSVPTHYTAANVLFTVVLFRHVT